METKPQPPATPRRRTRSQRSRTPRRRRSRSASEPQYPETAVGDGAHNRKKSVLQKGLISVIVVFLIVAAYYVYLWYMGQMKIKF